MNRRGGQIYYAVAASRLYAEPKRLEGLGYVSSEKRPGKTRERSFYTLTPTGPRRAARAGSLEPPALPRIQNEAVPKLICGRHPRRRRALLESLLTLRTELDAQQATLAEGSPRASTTSPHRRTYLLLVHELGERLIDGPARMARRGRARARPDRRALGRPRLRADAPGGAAVGRPLDRAVVQRRVELRRETASSAAGSPPSRPAKRQASPAPGERQTSPRAPTRSRTSPPAMRGSQARREPPPRPTGVLGTKESRRRGGDHVVGREGRRRGSSSGAGGLRLLHVRPPSRLANSCWLVASKPYTRGPATRSTWKSALPWSDTGSHVSPWSRDSISPSSGTRLSRRSGWPEPRKRSGPATVKPIVSWRRSVTRCARASPARAATGRYAWQCRASDRRDRGRARAREQARDR